MLAALPVAPIFLLYVALVATGVAVTASRSLSARATAATLAILVVWLGWAAILGYCGLVGDQSLAVPGVFVLLTPIVAFVAVVLGRSFGGTTSGRDNPARGSDRLPSLQDRRRTDPASPLGLGSVPKLMTLAGGNVEIVVGISAPLFAWTVTRGLAGRRIALA